MTDPLRKGLSLSKRAALVWVAACAGPGVGSEPLEVGAMERFTAEVEPVLEERCASGGCHGRVERPLSLYAPGQLRADRERLYLDEPLTAEELAHNARRLAAFAHGVEAAGSLALRKPLAQEEGGCWHGGGDVFADDTDPGYRAIAGWLATRRGTDGGIP